MQIMLISEKCKFKGLNGFKKVLFCKNLINLLQISLFHITYIDYLVFIKIMLIIITIFIIRILRKNNLLLSYDIKTWSLNFEAFQSYCPYFMREGKLLEISKSYIVFSKNHVYLMPFYIHTCFLNIIDTLQVHIILGH